MPTYCYACKCGHRLQKVRPVAHRARAIKCPACSLKMSRDLMTEVRGVRATPGNWPMYSDACGVHPSQIQAAKKQSIADGVPTDFTRDGRAILTGRNHRKRYVESIGMFDRNGGYGDPQRQGKEKRDEQCNRD